MLQAEDERLFGESIEDGAIRVYKNLEAAAERLKKEHESMTGVQEITTWKVGSDFPPHMKTEITFGPPPVIQTEKTDATDTLTAIQSAPTIEVLTTFKILANSDEQLRTAYMNRLKELTK